MGITKQYLRYVQDAVFGVIASTPAIVHLPLKGVHGRYVAVGACEHVFVWDLRKGEQVFSLPGDKSVVSCIACSSNGDFVAAGYADGAVRIFDLNTETKECSVIFSGHKSAVTCISYSHDGSRLVTGAKDTDIVVWDVVNESGIVRLHGHKGAITQCRFMKNKNVLVSSSKDTHVKFWDLDIQHCFHTLIGHRSEVWDFVLLKEDSLLVTGCNDSELRVWEIKVNEQPLTVGDFEVGNNENEDDDSLVSCKLLGSVFRQSGGRVTSLKADASERVLACQGPGSVLELFKMASEKRLKKQKQKLLKDPNLVENPVPLRKIGGIKAAGKVRSFDILLDDSGEIKAFLLLNNNSVEVYKSGLNHCEPEALSKIVLQGHRTDVRAVAFSSDNLGILSGSGESIKVWNRKSLNCIRTMDCGAATCLSFIRGDRHCIVGTKTGKLQLFDVAAASLLESIDAHQGNVWSLCLTPDQRGFVTGSADKRVKFWEYDTIKDEENSNSRLTFHQSRILQMDDDVLCVKISPDNRLLAVALLDSTVKVFFVDSLKFFLSLYGHKLPVLCLDISDDSTLLVSGSADRNVKIWGLDFGDCHRSLFAHDDSVVAIQFVPKTHLFFTGGKDGCVNQWDADTFQRIIKLQNHHAHVWSLAVSPDGIHVVTSSHDKSLRLYERTQEPLILEEEQEMEREEEYEKETYTGGTSVIAGETNKEAELAGRKTGETVKAAERLMEGLDVYAEETERLREHESQCKASDKLLPPPQPHPLFIAMNAPTPPHFFMETLKRIKSSELEEALLVLPFSYLTRMLEVLAVLIEKDWEIELVCRCLFFLLRVQHGQITSTACCRSTIEQLCGLVEKKVSVVKDLMNFNLAALTFVKEELESKEQVLLFEDASKLFGEKRKKRDRKAAALKRAILSL